MEDKFYYFRNGSKICKKHFKVDCSECTHTNISYGNADLKKYVVPSEQGIIQGVTSRTRELVRSHAFRFVLDLPKLDGWNKRDSVLRDNGFQVVRKAGIGKIFMSSCFNFKCWFADKSITIYFPKMKDYFVEEARFGYNYAVGDLLDLIMKLEKVFNLSFKTDNNYKFRVAGQHHALIHNSLAKLFNRNNERLNVHDKDGVLWLIVDNSAPDGIGLDELETVRKDLKNLDDNDLVRNDYNELRETQLTRGAIAESLNRLIMVQDKSMSDQAYYAENLKSHVLAIRELSFMVKRLGRRL